MLYIDPSLVQDALCARALPFVPNPVQNASPLLNGGGFELWDIDSRIDDVTRTELTMTVTNLLVRAAPNGGNVDVGSLDLRALLRARELITACPAQRHSMEQFEALTGLDRWSLARQFHAAFGTSTSRFRVQRKLDHARRLIKDGNPVVNVAMEARFADQSHMSRQFKSAYGLTPAKWASAVR